MSDKIFTQIGESLHGSIRKTAEAMKELLGLGAGALARPGAARDYLLGLITEQVAHGAAYLAVNVDVFGEDDPRQAERMMRDYVRLVRQYGRGVPVCVDSSDPAVLRAGLAAWYEGADGGIAKPLINSVKTATMKDLLPLNGDKPYRFIGMLVDERLSANEVTAERLHELARRLFFAAREYGFAADEMYFDTTTYPLAIDMPMTSDTPGFTYRAFEAIKRIKSDADLKGVHCTLGISNCCRDLPGRKIGICRAYWQVACTYGLDTAIVNVMHDYGKTPADTDLLKLVEAFARQDGSAAATMRAMELMGEFCAAQRK